MPRSEEKRSIPTKTGVENAIFKPQRRKGRCSRSFFRVLLDELPDELREHVTTEITAFDIERVSSKGANGHLVFGRNNISGKSIAVKYYYWGGRDDYHAEPQKLAGIVHKNVIQLDHAGYVDDNWAFFIMPQFQNGDLDDYIAQGQIDLRRSLYFVLGIASALAELHSKSLLHRDLKPENILLSDTNEAVIADFGSVKQIPQGAETVPGSGHSIRAYPVNADTHHI